MDQRLELWDGAPVAPAGTKWRPGDHRLPNQLTYQHWAGVGPAGVADLVEQGLVVVFDDLPPPVPLAKLRAVPVRPAGAPHQRKKVKLRELLAPCPPAGYAAHPLADAFATWPEAAGYQTFVRAVADYMRAAARRLFPGYTWTGEENHTWRYAETFAEGLHVDSYGGRDDECPRVRLFYNFDDVPRLWHVSWPAPELYRRYWECCNLAELIPPGTHPNAANALLTTRLRPLDLERHLVYFAPGTLWACDSQTVCHEVVYGRRCGAFTFTAAPGSMRDPARSFQNRVRAVFTDKQRPARGARDGISP
jgi:hypothetical protein